MSAGGASLPLLFALLSLARGLCALPSPHLNCSQPDFTLLVKRGYSIHPSCNGDKASELVKSLDELKLVARHAASYLKTHVSEDELIVRYFGKGADKSIPIATYTRIMSGASPPPIFRCDDIDGKCAANADWNGHWRDEIAETETVICNLSFESRLDLNHICTENVSTINQYWALDLIHRTLHLPSISQGNANHTAEGYEELLQLAKEDPSKTITNTDSLRSFAFEVISREYNPPNGCSKELF